MKKTQNEEKYQRLLAESKLRAFLEKVDREMAEKAHEAGCLKCGGKLHRADYWRKPRGLGDPPEWERRYSFCCSREGCRRRRTPPSVRFLGRKVYSGAVLVLVSAMTDGMTAKALERLRELFGIAGRTLKRWRRWWQQEVLQGPFWKAARSAFIPPVDEGKFVFCLWQRFGADSAEGLVGLLRFLSPLAGP